MADFAGWLREVWTVGAPTIIIGLPIYKLLFEKWIDRRMQFSLEAFKGDQQQEIERFRAEQQGAVEGLKAEYGKEIERLRHLLTSRISRIHEKEFDILPKAWLMLHEAQGAAVLTMNPFKTYPEFANLPALEREEFLNATKLSESKKQELLYSTDDLDFRVAWTGMQLQVASEKQRDFGNYLIENQIFMTGELDGKFSAVNDVLLAAITEYGIGWAANDRKMQLSAFEKIRELKVTTSEIEQLVKSRLHYDEA